MFLVLSQYTTCHLVLSSYNLYHYSFNHLQDDMCPDSVINHFHSTGFVPFIWHTLSSLQPSAATQQRYTSSLQDRIASLNGRTVQLVIRQDRPGFIRLIGISVLQSAASAILAPSLHHVAHVLALTWRRRLTAAAHSRYFRGNTFYSTSQLAGQLFGSLHLPACLLLC